ncbi:hypothetical protein CMI37_08770 [Candidatus Pacearchaeota archaeon]|nr:hypothetical protein [Candidatus Pacearchaeota archaeon]|tara:strand:+ start:6731 stop:7462 length:732 start_codon:yes stop_codon:yes gene_type:complete
MENPIVDSNVNFLRHSAFFGPEDSIDKTLNIIGVGATGSWVGLVAAKMGWQKFRVWDADIVESHNLPNQIYDFKDIGKPKVEAFKDQLLQFNPNVEVMTHNEFYTNEKDRDLIEDFVFVGVDTLSARKDIISGLQSHLLVDAIFETQMGFQHATLNYFKPTERRRIEEYVTLLKTDEEVEESACNARIMTTLSCIVASSVVQNICALASEERHQGDSAFESFVSEIPKKQIFSMPVTLSTFKT